MGRHYAALIYRHGFRLPPQSKEAIEFGQRSEGQARRFFPQILDEIQGFSEGCNSSYEAVLGFMTTIGIDAKSIRCSIFAAANDSQVVFGRNYDFFYKYKDYTESSLTVPDNGFASVGHSDVFIGNEDGVNEKMLAVGMTFVSPVKVRPGVNFPIITRYVLDRCSSVKQAVGSLKEVSYSTTNNYLLADASGDMAVVEAGPGLVRVRAPQPNSRFLACTNHFVNRMTRNQGDQKEYDPDSLRRYKSLGEEYRRMEGRIDISRAEEILSDNTGGLCSHHTGMGTLWSFVADLKEKRLMIAEGPPCKTAYREDVRLRRFAID